MNIFFRADANPDVGMGHIMRCLSIADRFSYIGHKVTFLLADESISLVVNNHGYRTIILHSDYTKMDEEKWPEIAPDLIIVDSYYVTQSYLRARKQTAKLVYIDDLGAFPYPVDILVNYNAYGPYLDYHSQYVAFGGHEPKYILGPMYAPLRTMFRGIEKKIQPNEVKHILISTGGSDNEHIALKIAQAELKNRIYHLLLGNMNPDKKRIKQLVLMNDRIVLHENVSDMKALICNMDLAVSAAGSTLYEICACGVPLITYILADNQIPGAEAFEKLNLAVNLGDIRNTADPGGLIISSIEALANNYKQRVETGIHMQSMIDGFGADRIVDIILKQFSIK